MSNNKIGMLEREEHTKKREPVSWYGTGNKLLEFANLSYSTSQQAMRQNIKEDGTNHVGTRWLQVFGEARIVLENDNIFWSVSVGAWGGN